MTHLVCDTSIIIRLVTGDDATKQERAIALFDRVEQGSLTLIVPDTVIADAVFVLSSPHLYRMPRDAVAARLAALVRLPNVKVADRDALLRALYLFATNRRLDFGDALVIALMQESGEQTVYAYDTDFDGVPGIVRKEP